MKRLCRGLTFANVCSFLALAVAISTSGAYAANTVFSTDIVNGQVKTPDLATNAVASPKILNRGVKTVDLNLNAVGSGRIADGAVHAADLGNDSVGAAEIVTDGVGATEIADNSIDSGEIQDNSLLSGDIGADQVGGSEIASSAVGGSEIASNAVTGGDVANDSLTLSDIDGVNIAGTITVNAGIANGRCVDLTLATPGTDAGDAVVLSLRADVADGLVFSGVRVPANDQTVAKMCNLTGAASPAVNQLPIRVVTLG
jgi:hypothetical protein